MSNILVVGAGSGIGKSLLDHLKKLEYFAIGLSRRGVPIQDELQSGTNYHCDLLVTASIDSFCENLANLSKLDAVYFCAGDGIFQPLSDIRLEEVEHHFRLNVTSQIYLAQKLESMLKKSASPLVVFLSSTAGKQGFANSSVYCASKHAIAGFAKSLREEWKEERIRVSCVYPGAIYTEIWKDRSGFSPEDMIPPEDFAKFLARMLDFPPSLNVDELYVLPPKGIL